MNELDPHEEEVELVQRCLEQDPDAIATLEQRYASGLVRSLIVAGATEAEATDIIGSLWGDCTVGDATHPPRFGKYHGKCALSTWLKTVATNELIDLKRRQTRFHKIEARAISSGGTDESFAALSPGSGDPPPAEAPLLALMKTALTGAMAKCPSQSFVMLRLVYLNGLSQREVAQLWGWHESKVSRALDSALELIASETLRTVKEADPWLEVGWDDFLELCRCTDFLTSD